MAALLSTRWTDEFLEHMYGELWRPMPILPMDLEMEIPAYHLVRVVNEAVNRLDDATFDAAYREVDDHVLKPFFAADG